jgi:two-component system, cell cycle sensor histidine kinase and response regulator CckA
MKSIRVLIIEDSEEDASSLLQELRRGGFAPFHTRITTTEALVAAIERSAWDALLSQYTTAPFATKTVFEILRNRGLDIPCLIISDAIDADFVAELMRMGAHDCLRKSDMARLVPALERELRHAALRQECRRARPAWDGRQEDERRLRDQTVLLDKVQDALFVTDLHGGIRYWSPSAQRLYGWTANEAQNRDLDDLLNPSQTPRKLEPHSAVLTDGEWMGELSHVTKESQPLTVQSRWTLMRDEAGQPESIVVVNTDVTQRKELEIKFLRAQRMESIGTLASGLAHDLNNVLAPILMALQTLKLDLPNESSQVLLTTLETSALRGANIIKQLLTFGRGIEGERIVLEPRYLIRELVKIAQETFPKTIAVKVNNPTNLWAVKGDPTQLHQVLLNLCLNARDAMPDGGQLTLTAENLELDNYYAQMNTEAKAGRYVAITVADTGRGIPPAILAKIFAPFYTTKAVGKGSGLGLATALGIVKSHGGFLQVTSQIGKGSQFKIFLPATTLPLAQIATTEPTGSAGGQGELILVVEDELPVRQVTETTLLRNGYRVLTADDGADGVAVFAQNRNEVGLVLTDMVMPFMDGAATIRALRKIKPEVKIIAISGVAAQSHESQACLTQVQAFLSKPFTAEQLLITLKKVLAQ